MFHESQGIQQQGRFFQVGEETESITGEHGKGQRSKVSRPCKKCGSSERTKHGACKACYQLRLQQNREKTAAKKILPRPISDSKAKLFCGNCGKEFLGWKFQNRKFCSQKCFGEQRRVFDERQYSRKCRCENCNEEFIVRPGEANRFCRNNCQHEFSVKRWLECSKCLARIGIGSKIASKLLGIDSSSISRGWKKRGIVAKRPASGCWKAKMGLLHADKKPSAEEVLKAKSELEYRRARMRDIKDASLGFDWSYLWFKEWSTRRSNKIYHSLSPDEKRERNKRCLELRKQRHLVDPDARRRDRDRRNEWKKRNPEKQKAYQRAGSKKWIKKRKTIDPGFRVQLNLRHRLKHLMKTVRKGGSASISSLMGCSTKQLANHLEAQFKRGMTWANYGTRWHVDHILPCASFDHTDSKQVAQCWHWTNLRPLDAKKNMEKSDSITEPQMSLLLCATH